MLCAPLDWQYAELPSSASDAVLCSVLVRKMWDILNKLKKKNKKKKILYDNTLFVKSAFSNYTFYLYPGPNFDF